jgi:hypothetical protein
VRAAAVQLLCRRIERPFKSGNPGHDDLIARETRQSAANAAVGA